jgi:hypothetical protein
MNRRTFLTRTVGLVSAQTVSSEPEVLVTLDPARTLAVIPPDFIGLGYEISSVARPGLLSAQDSVYVQLVRTLGTNGVVRVGGNTSDYASYSATGQALSSPEGKAGSVVNDSVLRDLGSFLDATDAVVVIDRGQSASFRSGSLVRLSGPSPESKSGVTLSGTGVSPTGLWKPTRI